MIDNHYQSPDAMMDEQYGNYNTAFLVTATKYGRPTYPLVIYYMSNPIISKECVNCNHV